MGISIDELEGEIKAYYRKNQYLYSRVSLKKGIEIPKAVSRQISKAELKYHIGEAIRLMIKTEQSRQLAHVYFDEAAEELGETADILTSRALLSLEEKKYEDALSYARLALEKDPKSRHTRRVFGIVGTRIYEVLGAGHVDLKEVRQHLIAAMKAYPDDATSHYFFALTYAFTSETPSKQALSSAKDALVYYRSLNFMKTNMYMADILEEGGDNAAALPVYEKIMVWGPTPGIRTMAARKVDSLKNQ